MDLAKAIRYARANARLVPIPENLDAHNIECIDGRSTRQADEVIAGKNPGERSPVAFPGGALGVPLAVLAAVNRQLIQPWHDDGDPRYEDSRLLLKFADIINFAEKYFDGMSCHTDDHNEHSELACAGCGHATGLLGNPRYALGEFYSAEFNAYAVGLKRRAEVKDDKVTLYSYRGSHLESAVMCVQSVVKNKRYISMRPTDGVNAVFIVNEVMGTKILKDFAGALYEQLMGAFETLGVSRNELLNHVFSTYSSHIRTSANRLAKGRPVYDVTEFDGEILVSWSALKF